MQRKFVSMPREYWEYVKEMGGSYSAGVRECIEVAMRLDDIEEEREMEE